MGPLKWKSFLNHFLSKSLTCNRQNNNCYIVHITLVSGFLFASSTPQAPSSWSLVSTQMSQNDHYTHFQRTGGPLTLLCDCMTTRAFKHLIHIFIKDFVPYYNAMRNLISHHFSTANEPPGFWISNPQTYFTVLWRYLDFDGEDVTDVLRIFLESCSEISTKAVMINTDFCTQLNYFHRPWFRPKGFGSIPLRFFHIPITEIAKEGSETFFAPVL